MIRRLEQRSLRSSLVEDDLPKRKERKRKHIVRDRSRTKQRKRKSKGMKPVARSHGGVGRVKRYMDQYRPSDFQLFVQLAHDINNRSYPVEVTTARFEVGLRVKAGPLQP